MWKTVLYTLPCNVVLSIRHVMLIDLLQESVLALGVLPYIYVTAGRPS